jgi:hypothetical protein
MFSNKFTQMIVRTISIKGTNQNHPLSLGRWLVEKDIGKINIKIDQSNEDHCGCCSNITKVESKPVNDLEEYYRPFVY